MESLPFLAASYVKTDVGTGLVHTAPAHGPDDYLLALQNNISIVINSHCKINDK